MQMVIDIPEDTYTYWINEPHERILAEAIQNGKRLPKGHGRLIDTNNLLTTTDIWADGSKYTYVSYDEIESAPTVIEADRSEEE